MAVVTIQSARGAGGAEVGIEAARLLQADYVDRLVLAEAAKRMGSTVQVLEIKGHRKVQLKDRIAYFLQTMLERSAVSGAGGEPYFSPGMEYLPAEEYTDLAQEPLTAAQRLNDEHFIEATSAVIKDLATGGNAVIIGRGSNMILRDMPGVVHVGLIAPMDRCIKTVMEREHLGPKDAEKYVADMEEARVRYFRKFFKVHPDDPKLYHLVLNMGTMGVDAAAETVCHVVGKLPALTEVEAHS